MSFGSSLPRPQGSRRWADLYALHDVSIFELCAATLEDIREPHVTHFPRHLWLSKRMCTGMNDRLFLEVVLGRRVAVWGQDFTDGFSEFNQNWCFCQFTDERNCRIGEKFKELTIICCLNIVWDEVVHLGWVFFCFAAAQPWNSVTGTRHAIEPQIWPMKMPLVTVCVWTTTKQQQQQQTITAAVTKNWNV